MVTLNRKGLLEEAILELIRKNKVFRAFTESLPENVLSNDIVVSFDYQPKVDNEYKIERCMTDSSLHSWTREPMDYPSKKEEKKAGRIVKGKVQFDGDSYASNIYYYSEDE